MAPLLPKQDVFSLWQFGRHCRIIISMKCKGKKNGMIKWEPPKIFYQLVCACVWLRDFCQYCLSPSDLRSSCKDFENPDSDLLLCGRLCFFKEDSLCLKQNMLILLSCASSYSQLDLEGDFICNTTILLGAFHV